jgi:hypothetical protein
MRRASSTPPESICGVHSGLTSPVAVLAGRESGRVALSEESRALPFPAEWKVAAGINEGARQLLEAGGKDTFMIVPVVQADISLSASLPWQVACLHCTSSSLGESGPICTKADLPSCQWGDPEPSCFWAVSSTSPTKSSSQDRSKPFLLIARAGGRLGAHAAPPAAMPTRARRTPRVR